MKMKAHGRILALFCVVMLVVASLAACGGNNNTASTPPPATTPEPEAPVTVTLKLTHHQNPGTSGDAVINEWTKQVEDASNGTVKIEVYGAQTLGKQADFYDMVINGTADIGYCFIPNFPGQFPVSEGVALPEMGLTSALQASQVLEGFYETSELMQAEYKDVHPLFFHSHDPAPIGTVSKKVTSAGDIKGLNLRVIGDGQIKMVQALGGGTVAIASTELYTSLEKGVIDGYAIGWEGIMAFKLPEVAKYIFDCNLYCGGFMMIMSNTSWNSLPPEAQAAFDAVSGMKAAELFGNTWDEMVKKSRAEAEATVEVTEISAEEQAKWGEIAGPIHEEWAANLRAKGIDGDLAYQQIQELVKKYA
ncbi:MAG: TRAP transporter substrate-binding protein [Clostridiales Family XIII bacterium]|jgi:TRAP-type C4-dicarboxylate transport system substrate-binding protein|nr:TRAP transporter substrate-binding protein [Clostridiales Family XIII bacterium]